MLLEAVMQSTQGVPRPFRFNRRASARWSLPGRATVIALGVELGATFDLEQLEGAPWWMSGMCSQTPPPVGTMVSVGFSDPALRHARAIVMRVDAARDHWRVAMKFEDSAVA